MTYSKSKQILLNEQRKIKTKIEGRKREIMKLESDLSEIEKDINKLN